jgi:hypothetical protein
MSEHVMKIGGKEYRAEVKEISSSKAKIVVNAIEYDVDLVSIGRREITLHDFSAARPVHAAPTAPAPPLQPLRPSPLFRRRQRSSP